MPNDPIAEPPLFEDQRGTVRWLVLNRPQRRNSLSPLLILTLRDALARAARDPEVKAVVLTGAGEKVFCAGADLGALTGEGVLAAHEERREYAGLLLDLRRLEKPIIAVVNGHALAGGLGIVCGCDLAIAADDAEFGTPEIDVGLFPYMALATIRACVGRRTAMELVLTGRRLDAAEAVRVGILNRAVPRAELNDRATELVESVASKSAAVLRLGRRAFHATEGLPFEAQLEALASQLTLNSFSEDAMEGIAAFLEKRKPDWKGK